MADEKKLPHIIVENSATTEEYLYPGGGGSEKPPPVRNRQEHAERLLTGLDRVRSEAALRKEELKAWAVPAKKGAHVQFESEPGLELELKSLEDRQQGIELVAVHPASDRKDVQLATVYVPEGKLASLEKKIRQYATEESASGRPRHRKLVAKIADLRLATLRSFWTDRSELLPKPDEPIWWEVWLRSPEEELLDNFRFILGQLEIEVGARSLVFPSTRVLLAYGTLVQFSASVEAVDSIAELRRAKEVASLFMEMPRLEQREWVRDLLQRTEAPPEQAARISLLDTGVNAGHPLLQAAIDPDDLHTIDPAWGVGDHPLQGHGTGMAGLALYGDLLEPLAGSDQLELQAWLESVRHRYASHGYRFDVRAATESLDDFKKRLNKAARDEDERSPGTGDPTGWCVGSNARHRGSVHSDIWNGPAADLADRQHVAVYPVSGWWKERYYMDRWRRTARYALLVSIHAPEIEVDLYTPVRTQVRIPIEI